MVALNAPSKITNFNYVSVFDENVFGLDVSMNEALFMHVVNTRAHLNKEVKCSVLAEELLLTDEIEEIAFAGVFEGKINSLFIFKRRIKSANILVIKLFLDSNLTD